MKKTRLFTILIAIFVVCETMAERPKIGLVFGGGGAKGAAEVGVLKVLEQAGVQEDYTLLVIQLMNLKRCFRHRSGFHC